jgi:hypothetical protein
MGAREIRDDSNRTTLTCALACAVMMTCTFAHSQPAETIGRIPCEQLTSDTLAAQPWNANGQPFGLPITAWTSDAFQALRSRITACHGDKPANKVRSLIRHVEHLEGHTKPILDDLVRKEIYDRLTADRQQLERIQKSELQAQAKAREATEAESPTRLKEAIAKIRSMPPTVETAQKLNDLLTNNNFRLPELTFPDQNTYHQIISEKLAELSNSRTEAKCAPVVSKLNVPPDLEGAVILTPVGNLSLAQFLCAAAVSTGRASIGANPRQGEGVYVLKIRDLTLTFEGGRYVSQADAFFPRSSPVQQGVKAISLRSATTPDGPIPLDRGFIVNLHAQFTPQMAVFLAQ